jgi:hypothetical protein
MQFSTRYLLIPVVAQMLCMALDEFYFHWQRQLPRWERVGHPLDTLTVLLCYGWLLLSPPSAPALSVYVGLCVFSCLFVTKDELVHRRHCRAGEHWLHAVLFTLHPLSLLSAGLLWPAWHGQTLAFLRYEGFEQVFLLGNTLLTCGFGFYQLIYWNFVWPMLNLVRSTTKSTIS